MHAERKKTARRSYHHGELKAALIESALALVREKGPRGFTLNETSRRAGVAVSAPYNHFRDKEALLIEIVVLGNHTLEAELCAAVQDVGRDREKLVAVYLAYIAFAERHPDLFAVMFQSGMDKEKYPEVHASASRAFAIGLDVAMRIEQSPKAGEELALAVWTMAHGFASLAAEHAMKGLVTSGTMAHLAEHMVDRLLQGRV